MILNKSLLKINEDLKNKKIKPSDIALEVLENYKKNIHLNTIISLNENFLDEAKKLDDEEITSIYQAIPIALKDNICTKDLRTTCASKMLDNFVPIYDAHIVSKIKENRMLIFGKTNMDEFAMGSSGETSYFGNVLNPLNESLVPGGSSSGSAAIVAAGILPFALGSDTGGSIRQPAAFCGVVGMKPTYGLVSRYGVVAFASSLDQVGPITKTVEDNALLLNLISGLDPKDQTSIDNNEDFTRLLNKDIKNLKIGIPISYLESVDPIIANKILEIKNLLIKHGAIVEDVIIEDVNYSVPAYYAIACAEATSNLARFDGIRYGHLATHYTTLEEMYKMTRSEGFGAEVKRRLLIGSYVLSGDHIVRLYNQALRLRAKTKENFAKVFVNYDLIISPTTRTLPYKFGHLQKDNVEGYLDDILTTPANFAGIPALVIPVGSNEVPVGLQILGPHHSEAVLYQLANYIEKIIGGK